MATLPAEDLAAVPQEVIDQTLIELNEASLGIAPQLTAEQSRQIAVSRERKAAFLREQEAAIAKVSKRI